jgi:hypothetical protein
MLHLKALTKKKMLMQVRDRKTLGIDTLFPILLIIIGLALATIAIFKNGVSRDMSPSIYNQGVANSMPLLYNSQSAHLSGREGGAIINKFVTDNVLTLNDGYTMTDGGPLIIEPKDKKGETKPILD